MKKIYIFGLGCGLAYLERCIKNDSVNVLGYIDNYKCATEKEYNGLSIINQYNIKNEFDYIVVTLMDYECIKYELMTQGIEEGKICCFFNMDDADNDEYWQFIDSYKWKTELMWQYQKNVINPIIENYNYEVYSDSEEMKAITPKIVGVNETVEILKNEKKSLSRFGDGEFDIIRGCNRAWFQKVDKRLADLLREALNSHSDTLLVAIADNYASLSKYDDRAAMDIRLYLTKKVRQDHMELLDLNRTYYDTYLSRPYIIYRDKSNAKNVFDNIKKIWDNQDVLIVEGEYTRFGVGNDLLDNARSIERIITPYKDSFSVYDEIKEKVTLMGENKLILAILGPTATVLAYEMDKIGYWILDIGQLDVEYGWYLCNATKRCKLKYKRVSEVSNEDFCPLIDDDEIRDLYENQIVCKILS